MTRPRPARLTIALLAVAAITALSTACSSDGQGPDRKAGLDEVTVLLDWTPNTNHSGLYVALERGWYRKAGLDVRIQQPGDTSNLQLLAVGKAYSGLTDAEIAGLTRHFMENTIEEKGRRRTVAPDIVLEVAFDSIHRSDRHPSGYALRFPRIVRIRDDKTPADIDTLATCAKLASGGAFVHGET